jgi:hypothetical protein
MYVAAVSPDHDLPSWKAATSSRTTAAPPLVGKTLLASAT